MAPPRKRALPKPLPDDFVLTDTEKKRWRLGKIIGQGGFGLIYLASKDIHTPVPEDTGYVIKVEYHENGPLFSELKFYQRAAKPDNMQRWVEKSNLDFLGIPGYWGSGLAEHNGMRYRFMAMDRLGCDLQQICKSIGGRLRKATVLQLGLRLLDVLEYIHDSEYVHADIKAANVMLGYQDPEKVYLVDYGLSYRYCPDGVHKEYKENPKKGHNGTIEYTSLDAHNGVGSLGLGKDQCRGGDFSSLMELVNRRGDLQILGFCLLHWLCGNLPWDSVLHNPTLVQEAKARLTDNLPDSVQRLAVSGVGTDEVARFLLYVRSLGYQGRPDYQRLRDLLAVRELGNLNFSRPKEEHSGGMRTSKALDPSSGDKKTTQARRTSRPRPAAKEEDEERREDEIKQPLPASSVRRPLRSKQQSTQVDPPEQSLAGKASSAVRKSSRTKLELAGHDEEARPKPISKEYLWAPPIRPKPSNTRSLRRVDDCSVTSARLKPRDDHNPISRKHSMLSDFNAQEHHSYTNNLDEVMVHCRRWGRWDNGNHHKSWDTFPHGGTEKEPGPVQWPSWTGQFHCIVFMAIFLFLVSAVTLI